MQDGGYSQGIRQRLAQVFLWLLGRKQTQDQYRQSARQQGDGQFFGQQDPDVSQQQARQAREAFDRQQRQGGGRYGR